MQNKNAFQPFTDRLSRDVRNDLSKSFVLTLEANSLEPVQSAASRYLGRELATGCKEYIKQRLERYARVLEIPAEERTDPLTLCFILWDEGLFFEVHEILEPLWLAAKGEEKLLYQALIRAAGVYIKYEAGYPEIASRIGAKALPVLERNRPRLARYIDVEALIAAVTRPSVIQPRLHTRRKHKYKP